MTRKCPDSRASQPNEYQKLQAEVADLKRALFDARKAWLDEGMQSNQYKAQRDELWEQYQDACLYVDEYFRNKWGHDATLKKYAFLNTDGEKKA